MGRKTYLPLAGGPFATGTATPCFLGSMEKIENAAKMYTLTPLNKISRSRGELVKQAGTNQSARVASCHAFSREEDSQTSCPLSHEASPSAYQAARWDIHMYCNLQVGLRWGNAVL